MISEKAKKFINHLINQPVSSICREADMGDFHFGNYALHIQCPFRMISNTGKIIVTSYDIYLDKNGNRLASTHWDRKGKNRYDIEIQKWLANHPDTFVKNVSLNMQGDLKIIFSNDDSLEIFVNCSTNEECWRFFEPHADKEHLVISGIGDDYD
ncbi:MAG: hypothetical protein K2O52_01670 [Oscillospiraceae bacterium]|nr:hypothetical protein [Oscillospiraceae bacterium]